MSTQYVAHLMQIMIRNVANKVLAAQIILMLLAAQIVILMIRFVVTIQMTHAVPLMTMTYAAQHHHPTTKPAVKIRPVLAASLHKTLMLVAVLTTHLIMQTAALQMVNAVYQIAALTKMAAPLRAKITLA